jgi:hypothetical protein
VSYDHQLSRRSYKSAFDPEALRVLQEVFDLAVVELASQGISIDDRLARSLIARQIFEAARDRGETAALMT